VVAGAWAEARAATRLTPREATRGISSVLRTMAPSVVLVVVEVGNLDLHLLAGNLDVGEADVVEPGRQRVHRRVHRDGVALMVRGDEGLHRLLGRGVDPDSHRVARHHDAAARERDEAGRVRAAGSG